MRGVLSHNWVLRCLPPSCISSVSSTMASLQQRKSIEKSRSRDDEKEPYDVTATVSESVDDADGDEALKLVGKERVAQFSEEYNKKLRRKLVRTSRRIHIAVELIESYRIASSLRCVLRSISRNFCKFTAVAFSPLLRMLRDDCRDKTSLNYAR